MKAYLNLLEHLLDEGVQKGDRTGTGTLSVFGYQMRFDLSEGFPCLTTKKLHLKSIIHELLWFLKGDTNIQYLKENGVRIWDEWADEQGDLGPVYGYQWRSWPTPSGGSVDQIQKLINSLKQNPNSRRHIVSAWNPAFVDDMALPPCHCLFQFYVANNKLSLYSNHIEQAKLQLTRTPKKMPSMRINPEVKDLFDFTFEDFELVEYDPHPHIKAAVSV